MDYFTDPASLQRAALLLGPLLITAALFLLHQPTPRQATAAMVALLWNLPALLLLHVLANHAGLWRYATTGNLFLELPIDVWIGWAVWWGPVAVFIAQRWGNGPTLLGMVALDLLGMPLLQPLLELSPDWTWGEPLAIALVLGPALWFAHLTAHDRQPLLRTTFHGFGWAGYVLFLLPAAAYSIEGLPLHPGDIAQHAIAHHGWPLVTLLVAVIIGCLLVGASAALEFAVAGDGTPIPYDPPKRVVSSGPYAYIANPMQVTVALKMLALGWLTHSVGLLAVALSFVVFDAIFAAGYNRIHIARAFPNRWSTYLADVPEWRLRRHPSQHSRGSLSLPDHHTRLRHWLQRRAHHLELNPGPVIRYQSPNLPAPVYGGRAILRALEHTHLGWALPAWTLRAPLEVAAALHQWHAQTCRGTCRLRRLAGL